MSNNYDVIIAGSGPAGVSSALSCLKEKLNVLLIDSKPKDNIGDKVCGEALSKKTVMKISDKLNLSPPSTDEINTNIETMVLRTEDPKVSLTLPAIGFMIDRRLYGQRLLDKAIERGVKLQASTKIVGPLINEEKVIGVRTKNLAGEEKDFFGKIVIDCTGCKAIVRRRLPESFEPLLYKELTKQDFASCYREIIELKESHNLNQKIVLQYEKNIPEPGYIWFFGDGGKKVNCGTGFRKTGENKDLSVKKVYHKTLEKYYAPDSYEVIDGRGDCVPVQPPLWNAVAPGLIVAGDAAFHADPLTAEGHGPALLAGWIAGEVSAKAIESTDFSTRQLWEYNLRIMKEFGAENTLYKVLADVLEQLGAKNLKFLIERKVIRQTDLTTEGLGKQETILSVIQRAIRCFPKIKLLYFLKKSISASKKITELCERFPLTPEQYLNWKKQIESVYDSI